MISKMAMTGISVGRLSVVASDFSSVAVVVAVAVTVAVAAAVVVTAVVVFNTSLLLCSSLFPVAVSNITTPPWLFHGAFPPGCDHGSIPVSFGVSLRLSPSLLLWL